MNAETAENPQNTQRRAGNVATTLTTLASPRFPPDYLFFKNASGHRVIARKSGVDDTWALASALSARSLRSLRSFKIFMQETFEYIDSCLNPNHWHIVIKDNAVVELNYSANDCVVVSELSQDCSNALEREAQRQLEEYFAGQRKTFDLPLRPQGTEFQRRVWKELLHIPYGQTATYGEIAKRIGRPNAARAVGQACNANPIPIFIPCHRVIGSNSRLTGFAFGLDVKTALLELERETLF